jgi:hypothetical protein
LDTAFAENPARPTSTWGGRFGLPPSSTEWRIGEAAVHGQGAEVLTNPLNRRKGAGLEFLISRTHI